MGQGRLGRVREQPARPLLHADRCGAEAPRRRAPGVRRTRPGDSESSQRHVRDAVRTLLRRVWYLVRLRRLDAELAEELEFHRAMTQRELERNGLPERDARFQAHRTMGNVGLARDRARDLWQPRWLQGCGLDVRLALRLLVASPVLSA